MLDGLGDLVPLLPVALGLLAADDGQYASLKRDLRSWAKSDPIDALVATVLGGGIAFYLAERERNPACAALGDGILYVATCLSVGYDNLFPTTPTGHAIASAVQTFGPALANMAFDTPAAEARASAQAEAAEARARADEDAAVNRAILARLDDIVRLLGERQPERDDGKRDPGEP
jgi:outer membrane murein-binding lipoprotein Lpp